jgi:hypothetical protein
MINSHTALTQSDGHQQQTTGELGNTMQPGGGGEEDIFFSTLLTPIDKRGKPNNQSYQMIF